MTNQPTHDDDEFEVVELAVDDLEIRKAAAAAKPRALVIVDNLDDGDTIRFWVRFNAKIRRVIRQAYTQLALEHEDGDRLICVEDQENVFDLEHETVKDYVERHGGAAQLHWHYSGPAGGASR